MRYMRAGARTGHYPFVPTPSEAGVTEADGPGLNLRLQRLDLGVGRQPELEVLQFLPFSCCTFSAMWQHLSRKPAIFLKSSAVQPRVVMAGAPMRTPPGDNAEASPCTAFLFSEMEDSSQTFSSLEPVRPWGRKSHKTRWLSVPSLASLW